VRSIQSVMPIPSKRQRLVEVCARLVGPAGPAVQAAEAEQALRGEPHRGRLLDRLLQQRDAAVDAPAQRVGAAEGRRDERHEERNVLEPCAHEPLLERR